MTIDGLISGQHHAEVRRVLQFTALTFVPLLSKYPLLWMINQAKAAGLKTSTAMVNYLVLGKPRKDSSRVYSKPDPRARLHKSLTGLWWLLEVIPKRTKWREWLRRPSLLGFYLPLAATDPGRRADPWIGVRANCGAG